MGFKVSETEIDNLDDLHKHDYDVMWLDGACVPDRLSKMKSHQRVNHFPGMYFLAQKHHLGRNLTKMVSVFPKEYNFFPKTWLLPSQ